MLLVVWRCHAATTTTGRRDERVAYKLRPYVGDVREQEFATEMDVFSAVRQRWPNAAGALNSSEDDHDLYVIVWMSPEAQAKRDKPVALVAKDPADAIFDAVLWRASA